MLKKALLFILIALYSFINLPIGGTINAIQIGEFSSRAEASAFDPNYEPTFGYCGVKDDFTYERTPTITGHTEEFKNGIYVPQNPEMFEYGVLEQTAAYVGIDGFYKKEEKYKSIFSISPEIPGLNVDFPGLARERVIKNFTFELLAPNNYDSYDDYLEKKSKAERAIESVTEARANAGAPDPEAFEKIECEEPPPPNPECPEGRENEFCWQEDGEIECSGKQWNWWRALDYGGGWLCIIPEDDDDNGGGGGNSGGTPGGGGGGGYGGPANCFYQHDNGDWMLHESCRGGGAGGGGAGGGGGGFGGGGGGGGGNSGGQPPEPECDICAALGACTAGINNLYEMLEGLLNVILIQIGNVVNAVLPLEDKTERIADKVLEIHGALNRIEDRVLGDVIREINQIFSEAVQIKYQLDKLEDIKQAIDDLTIGDTDVSGIINAVEKAETVLKGEIQAVVDAIKAIDFPEVPEFDTQPIIDAINNLEIPEAIEIQPILDAINSVNATVTATGSFLGAKLDSIISRLGQIVTAIENLAQSQTLIETPEVIIDFQGVINKLDDVIDAINYMYVAGMDPPDANIASLYRILEEIKDAMEDIRLEIVAVFGAIAGLELVVNIPETIIDFTPVINAIEDIEIELAGQFNGLTNTVQDLYDHLQDVVVLLMQIRDQPTAVIDNVGTVEIDLTTVHEKLSSIYDKLTSIRDKLGSIHTTLNNTLAGLISYFLEVEDINENLVNILQAINNLNFESNITNNFNNVITEINGLKGNIFNVNFLPIINAFTPIFNDFNLKLADQIRLFEDLNLEITGLRADLQLILDALNGNTLNVNFTPILNMLNQFEANLTAKLADQINTTLNFKATFEAFTVDVNANFKLIIDALRDIEIALGNIVVQVPPIELPPIDFPEYPNPLDYSNILNLINDGIIGLGNNQQITNEWAEKIHDLLKPDCTAIPPGITDPGSLPALPPGEPEYCEFPEEEPTEPGLATCPVDIWQADPFPVVLVDTMSDKFPLDIVGTMPAPITDDQLTLEFFDSEVNVSWFVDAIEALKYPAWLAFVVWIIVTL